MQRRQFLASVAALAASPLVPKSAKKPSVPTDKRPTAPAPLSKPCRRMQWYKDYERMLDDPPVRRMLDRICDRACEPYGHFTGMKVQVDCHDRELPEHYAWRLWHEIHWPHPAGKYFVFDRHGPSPKSPFRIAQRLGGGESLPLYPPALMDDSHRLAQMADGDAAWTTTLPWERHPYRQYRELGILYAFGMGIKGRRRFRELLWSLAVRGDLFFELVRHPDRPGIGIVRAQELSADTMYRIETTKRQLIEFQQSKEGPDYQALVRAPVTQATDADNRWSFAVRFAPDEIVHARLAPWFYPFSVSLPAHWAEERRTDHYPYGSSLLEPAAVLGVEAMLGEESYLAFCLRQCLLDALEEVGRRDLKACGCLVDPDFRLV